MAKEHWATKLKRENKKLKAENAGLRDENQKLRFAAASSPQVPKGGRPNYLYISVLDAALNWACEGQTFKRETEKIILRRKPLADDQIDIVVEDQIDKAEGAQFSAAAVIEGDWEFCKKNFKKLLSEANAVFKHIRTIYDPHGFTAELGMAFETRDLMRLKVAFEEEEQNGAPE